jgi:hypothetical protein
MSDLVLLYSAEIFAGLEYRAVHLTANFGQVLTRSNLQDSQISGLIADMASAEGRLDTAETHITTAEADIVGLKQRSPSGGYTVTSSTHTASLEHPIIWLDGSAGANPVITLPDTAGMVGGERIECASSPIITTVTVNVEDINGLTESFIIPGGESWTAVVQLTGVGAPVWTVSIERVSGYNKMLAIYDRNYTITAEMTRRYSSFIALNQYVVGTSMVYSVYLPKIADVGAIRILGYVYSQDHSSDNKYVIREAAADGGAYILTVEGHDGENAWYEFFSDPIAESWLYRKITWVV